MDRILIPDAALPSFARNRAATLMPVMPTVSVVPSWGSAPSTDAGSRETRRVHTAASTLADIGTHSYVSTDASRNAAFLGGAAKQGAPPRREPR